ncbi:ATP-binding protein [Granulibacter bethesdensis]|uniref:ATP-binding protein n=1 Tax=Granulibacter bethesdensis TaxID=364410 RepID=UPI0003F1CC46|nr:ATP-binding protein [Granulibacter bethesdensis]AHJ68251.1 Two component system histidine kinase [Granulibacter bethesdensis]
MKRFHLWPRGLIGRVTLVLLLATLLEFLGSTIVYEQTEIYYADDLAVQRVAERLALSYRVLMAAEEEERPALAKRLSSPDLQIGWFASGAGTSPTDPVQIGTLSVPGNALSLPPTSPRDAGLLRMQGLLINSQDLLENVELRLSRGGRSLIGTRRDLIGTMRLPGHVDKDGPRDSAIVFFATGVLGRLPGFYGGLLSAAILACCVLAAAAMLVRTLGLPLRTLAQAADAIGHGPPVQIKPSGPREVRQVAQAFNAMQTRISHLINDRTQALAAVSHDLRTPIQRLRLRASFLDDTEAQTAIEDDLDEMEAMVSSVLAFLAGDTDPEKHRPADLATMLETLVDDASDAGQLATYSGPEHCVHTVRPVAMKRAFANLIGNALKYASRADVTLFSTDHNIQILIEDNGPGIPEAELENVLEPFRRIEVSRNRDTGGMGLGLAIVRQIVEREGGTITLSNRTGGGLQAKIVLPLHPPQTKVQQTG